ncbi:signal peptide peptidase-domain-containing protein [Mariannaea sp. PMI_226]|nr:signal peptide peptidase-domain-containing protein [Mariannaea sp. PMI_226]
MADPVSAPLEGETFPSPEEASYLQYFHNYDFLLLELQLIVSTLGIIWVGAHASLRRPPSAAPSKKRKPGEEEDEGENFSQGLEPSDAILFPLMAAAVLVGLYYAIQWLKDPDIINRFIRVYMSVVSVASLVSLYSHTMDLATRVMFPRFWRGRDGKLRAVDQRTRTVELCDAVGNRAPDSTVSRNPFPGFLGFLGMSEKARNIGWSVRDLLTRRWVVKLYVHGMGKEDGRVKFSHILGFFGAVATSIAYSYTSSTTLANMLGYGMCYGSFQLISPTDYLTGSMVLMSLFVYDIVMVFYTPYMVTVATKLDAPIKLTFKVAERSSILGLGDIVIPGIVIALALRFDLYLHYMRKIKYEQTDLQLIEKDPSTGAVVTKSEFKHKEVKAKYVNVKGNWGDSLWVRESLFLFRPKAMPPSLEATVFRKTYFYASMIGYLLGIIVTLLMLLVFKRGQPALLYLVPGVLGSLWLTGLLRGEVLAMWKYTEDGSIDTIDVVVDLDGDGKPVKEIGKLKDGVVDTTKKDEDSKAKDGEKSPQETKAEEDKHSEKGEKGGHKVFVFSVEAPEDEVEDLPDS